MRSTRRSRWSALAVFLLISGTVIGGMGWATATSVELAREHVRKAHDRKIERAMWRLEAWTFGVLASESRRPPDDYVAFQVRDPLTVVHRGQEIEADWIVEASPLAINHPPDWIDVYFQVGPVGEEQRLTTPMPVDDTAMWRFRSPRGFEPWMPRARRTWEWLRTALPEIDLQERVAQVCENQRLLVSEAEARARDEEPTDDGDTRARGRTGDFGLRKRSFGDAQAGYLPPTQCLDPDRIAALPRGWIGGTVEPSEERESDGPVEVTTGPFVAFWLGTMPNGAQKLAFVREVHRGPESQGNHSVWLQGFVADWSELKPELLTQIDDVGLVAAELEPMLSESAGDPSRIERQMINLPVRLQVPDIPGGATAAAWREIGGKLITPWVAAGAVLVVAGWGLRNLLKLTERRMQFAYAVTHELRTPLTTFQLYSDMLSAGMVPEEAKQSYLETLYRESARLSNLVEGVLEYARLENQRVRLTPREIDAASLLSVIGEHLERRCHENGVTPKTEASFANGLPLRTDVDVVNRIAGVLVNNAVRHAQGAGDATVLVRLSGDNGEVHLDVIDSGPGVDRADARAIFRPFRRGRKADAAAQGGIGLGLALARSWARLLGGKVELAARHDPKYGGAHFRLRFPARLDS